ncbi:MAG: HEPN domain-containing protein [Bacteroidota bacterium]|nr:HEPN domain-containing protein [Bacteroidota bacterium]
MPNRTYALEWLNLAKRNLDTARLLIRENHYTDSIAIEIQQTIEKSFKAVYAYYGINIPRTHALTILFNFVNEKIPLDVTDIEVIITISDYYETDRYPGPRYVVPPREEVETFFIVAEQLYSKIEEHILT